MRGYESCPFHNLFTMEPAAVLTVADLRGRAITNWVQDVKLHVPFERSPPMEAFIPFLFGSCVWSTNVTFSLVCLPIDVCASVTP